MRFAIPRAAAIVAVLMILLLALPAFAVNIVPSGVTAGTGGVTTKGGQLAVQTVAGSNLFSVTKGTGAITAAGTNAASAGFNLFDYTATLGIMDGTDDFCVFDINLTSANHTGTSTMEVLDIAAITGDAQCTEKAIVVGTGWDAGLDIQSPSTLAYKTVVLDTTAERVCTSADYGKTIMLSYAGAVAVTLPANGATGGAWIDFIVIGADTCAPTIAAATADTLITFNDATADSVTFGTGHRIGAYVRVISTGTYWVAINMGSHTMTVTTN